MGLRRFLRDATPAPLLTAIRRARRSARVAIDVWRAGPTAPPPWSPAYFIWRDRFLARAVRAPEVRGALARGGDLPPSYGIGLDERCVEYPWLLSRIPEDRAPLLDAGGGANHTFVLDDPAMRGRPTTVLTLAPERGFLRRGGVDYRFGDLREPDLPEGAFGVIACVSTLEHVGFDNTPYTGEARHREHAPSAALDVMKRLRRLLRPGGRLLLTVPFGAPGDFGHFRQFDSAGLAGLVEAFGPAAVDRTFFRYGPGGWRRADEAACRDAAYVEWLSRPRAEWPDPPRLEPDRAVAARAVACLELARLQ